MSMEELLRRITGRRTCPTCKRIYNIYSHTPAKEGICDFDGTPLQHRSDDTEDGFLQAHEGVRVEDSPVIEHYRGAELLPRGGRHRALWKRSRSASSHAIR